VKISAKYSRADGFGTSHINCLSRCEWTGRLRAVA